MNLFEEKNDTVEITFEQQVEKINRDLVNIKITKLLNLLGELAFRELKKEMKKGIHYFYFNSFYFDNKIYSRKQHSFSLNYQYDLVGKDIYCYINQNQDTIRRELLIPKIDNADELIDTIIKNKDTYIQKMINMVHAYIKEKNQISVLKEQIKKDLIGKPITLVNEKEKIIFELNEIVIPNQFTISNLFSYAYNSSNSIYCELSTPLKTRTYSISIYLSHQDTHDSVIEKIKKELLEHLNTLFKKELRNQLTTEHVFKNLNIYFKNSKNEEYLNNVLDDKEVPLLIDSNYNKISILSEIDTIREVILFKKKIKKAYYLLLANTDYHKDRPTKVKFINFVDNYLKTVRFSFNQDVVNHETIFYIYDLPKTDELANKLFNDYINQIQ